MRDCGRRRHGRRDRSRASAPFRGTPAGRRRSADGRGAARRPAHRAGHLAGQHDARLRRIRIGHRDRAEQRARIVVARAIEHAVHRADLHDASQIHHRDMRADEPHRAQIVRNVQIGQPKPVLERGEQVQDLRAHRHVQRRHRLVADQHIGLHRQCPRDADALALAARYLVRVARRMMRLQPHLAQQGGDPRRKLRPLGRHVDAQRLAQRLGRRPARIECQHRVLKDVLQPPAHAQHRRAVIARQRRPHIHAMQPHGAAAGRGQMQDAARRRRLAAAAFAHQAQGLATADGERHVIDGMHVRAAHPPEQPAPHHRVALGQVIHPQQRHAACPVLPRRRQLTVWPGASGVSTGSSVAQSAIASGQRARNRQPAGVWTALGGWPGMEGRLRAPP
jgi:hypothetical protein